LGGEPQNGDMMVTLPPLPSFFATDVLSVAMSSGAVKPIDEPFLDGMSGCTTLLATKAGRIFFASLPDVVPSRDLLSEPPQAASSGIPPATAAVTTAVEARKLLRLGAEEAEEAFGVIASTLHGAPGHPAVEPSAAVS
jgi:hypothetical protein